MIKESKYIIRRIIIGVGIVLALSFLNGCEVKAMDRTIRNFSTISKSNLLSNNDIIELKSFNHINFYRNISNGNVYFCADFSNICYYMYFNDTTYNFNYKNLGLIIASDSSMSSTSILNQCVYMSTGDLPKLILSEGRYNNAYYYSDTYYYCTFTQNSTNTINVGSYGRVLTDTTIQDDFYKQTFSLFANNISKFANYNWNYLDNYFISNDDIINIGNAPEFVSFNSIPITTNNVITSYTVQPEFSLFDTDNYVYQYSFDNNGWLSLTENEQIIRINGNSTIYVRIKDKNNNDIVDTATFKISNIGTFYDNQTYNINFSGEYRTENYLNNNLSSKSQSIIQEYQIYIDYIPKSSILKYQYQYVNDGDSLDNNSWQDVSSSDNGSFTYVASENGTLYARILDSSDNILYSSTFTVNSIGLLAFDSNQKGINNFFTKLSNKISYGGPISNLFIIPIDILNIIYDFSSSTCSPYKISTLLGTDIVLPCFDFKAIFGDTIYILIDSLLCFVLTLRLIKFIHDIYDKFVNMEDISS